MVNRLSMAVCDLSANKSLGQITKRHDKSYLEPFWIFWGWTMLKIYGIKNWHHKSIKQQKETHQYKNISNRSNILIKPHMPFPHIGSLTRTKLARITFQPIKQNDFWIPIMISSWHSPSYGRITCRHIFRTFNLILLHPRITITYFIRKVQVIRIQHYTTAITISYMMRNMFIKIIRSYNRHEFKVKLRSRWQGFV